MKISKQDRLLVIAPHADDEILGCGGLISKVKKAGGKVFVLIFNVGSVSDVNNEPEHSRWSINGVFEPNLFIDIEKFLNKKINAFYKYKSQVKQGVRDKNTITTQAEYRGREIGGKLVKLILCTDL